MASCNIISLIGYIRRHLLITLRNYLRAIIIYYLFYFLSTMKRCLVQQLFSRFLTHGTCNIGNINLQSLTHLGLSSLHFFK